MLLLTLQVTRQNDEAEYPRSNLALFPQNAKGLQVFWWYFTVALKAVIILCCSDERIWINMVTICMKKTDESLHQWSYLGRCVLQKLNRAKIVFAWSIHAHTMAIPHKDNTISLDKTIPWNAEYVTRGSVSPKLLVVSFMLSLPFRQNS